jgi:hypothetical protein
MKKIIIILVGILGIVAIYNFWDYIGYARAIRKDSQRLFASHKEFFKSLEFSGIIAEKKYCDQCALNKYELVVDIREKKPEKVEIGNTGYGGYYLFNDKNQLKISVTQQIYKSAEKDSLIKKEMNSDSLSLLGLKYRFLSDQKSQWLAEDK